MAIDQFVVGSPTTKGLIVGEANCLIVLDPDSGRRATIAREVLSDTFHVEPYESIRELDHWWNDQSVLLVYDEMDIIPDVVSRMKEKGLYQPIIAYRDQPSIDRVVSAIFAGALDYLEWPFRENQLLSHIEIAKKRFNEVGDNKSASRQSRLRIESLSSRELQVLSLLAGGRTNVAIANKLEISPRTVEIHRANMMSKLGAKHVAEAVQAALDADVVIPKQTESVLRKKKVA